MTDLIEFLNSHASVRQFAERDISDEDARLICATAERSPTSSNLHAYSIITVRDQPTKKTLATLCGGQDHVAACPLFLVFCADLNRLNGLAEERGYSFNGDTVEMLIVATVDAALVGGRALIAAQALGLGGVMVGGIRNRPDEVCRLLDLPDRAYPVMGMSLGYPARSPRVKPRLPLEGICFPERYSPAAIGPAVTAYDRTMKDLGYLRGREVEPEKYPAFDGVYAWSEHSARRMASDAPGTLRLHMKTFLQKRGLMKR